MTDAHADAIDAAALAVVNRRRQIFDLPIIASRQDSRSGDVGALLSAQAAITAYLASMSAAGWVIVPGEPTQAMVRAAAQLDFSAQHDPTWPEFYRAMVTAAMLADPAPKR